MRHHFSLCLLMLLLCVKVGHAQCPNAYIVKVGQAFDRPDPRFTKLDVVKASDGASLKNLTLRAKPGDTAVQQWVVSIDDGSALRQLRNTQGSANLRLRWSGAGAPCDVPFTFADEAVAPPNPDASGTEIGAVSTDLSVCRDTGAAWKATLDGRHGEGNYAIVILTDAGEACYTTDDIDQQSEGDPIYVGMFTIPEITWRSPRYAPCALQTSTPKFNAPASGTTVFQILSSRESKVRAVAPAEPSTPQRCFNENVEISVEGKPDDGALRTVKYNLRQHPRHHFTLQLGAYDSNEFQHSFGTRTVDGKARIFDKGPSGDGVQYYAGVVVYGAPHYLTSLIRRDRLYPGRDLVNDQSWRDRTSFIVGAGLENPSAHFVVGVGFELINGVNVTYTYNRRRFKTLAEGVNVGDEFAGAAADIPMREFWNNEMAFGLSLDLGYALRFLQR